MERKTRKLMILAIAAVIAFLMGFVWSYAAHAESSKPEVKKRIVYPKKTTLDFEGLSLEGEVHNPGEFYFQRRPEEKFDSLVKRRKNFQREMLRDAVISK